MSLTHELAGLMSKIVGRFRRVPMQIGLMLRRETMRVHGPALDTWQPLSDGRGFEEITLLCCPWYFRYKLSYRDLVGTPPPRAISAVSARGLAIPRYTQYAPKLLVIEDSHRLLDLPVEDASLRDTAQTLYRVDPSPVPQPPLQRHL